MNKFILFIGALYLCLAFPITVNSQTIVNAYASVSSISGAVINVDNVDEANDLFEVGEDFFIMQVQDDVIGANTGDNSSFGNLNSIENAGLFTRYTVSSVTRSGGILTSITVTNSTHLPLYTISANTSVQVISVPVLGAGGDFTTTDNISCPAWDGEVGGVVAFEVDGTLNLLHDINVDGKGFRGGAADTGGSGSCNSSIFRISTSGNYYADKGEGIYKNTNSDYVSGRGHILSGGGGGNSHNAGGAGGGNASVGGAGGFGWNCDPTAGGIGGLDLSSYISTTRVFLGGGGGSGEGNNDYATAGGIGGGIILIGADELATSASCGGVYISAIGNDGADCAGNDGAGGGGAGGSVILNIPTYNINASCEVTVTTNGGAGGSVSSTAEHGGGGGGGMGRTILSTATPTNMIVNGAAGNGGDSGGSNDNPGDTGSDTPDDGEDEVVEGDDSGPLPVELIKFIATQENEVVVLNWITASEENNMGFDLQVSYDNENWNRFTFVQGNINSNTIQNYVAIDNNPVDGTNYYRLKQIDYDGKYEYSSVTSVKFNKGQKLFFSFVPNPAKDVISIKHNIDEKYSVSIYSTDGRLMLRTNMLIDDKTIDVSILPFGVYSLIVNANGSNNAYKLIICK